MLWSRPVWGIQTEQAGYRPGPHFNAFPMASYGTALLAVMATTTALYARTLTGSGQHVDVSMEDGVLAMSSMFWQWVEKPGYSPSTVAAGSGPARRMLGGIRECGDGKYLQIHTGAPGAFYRAITTFGLQDRISPSPSSHEMTLPLTDEEAGVLQTELPRLLQSKPRAYWIENLQEADVAVMAVDPPGVVLDDPQAIHNKAVITMEDPELGQIKTVGPVMMVPSAPAEVRGPAPQLGQQPSRF